MAGGQGLRMGSTLPKQFIPLEGLPVLMHTMGRFVGQGQIILVLPEAHIDYWQQLCRTHGFTQEHTIQVGGQTRYHSVLAALRCLWEMAPGTESVAIHDGVRPFVAPEVIEACFRTAELSGAALPYRPMTDSLRELQGEGSISRDRDRYVAVQTPQVFEFISLYQAYEGGYQPGFTDDASVWEAAYPDRPIQLVEGNVENIKLTNPMDLDLARILISRS